MNNDLGLCVALDPIETRHLSRNGFADRRQSFRTGIAIDALLHGMASALAYNFRHGSVTHALGQVDALDLFALQRHHPDFRLYGARGALAGGKAHVDDLPLEDIRLL